MSSTMHEECMNEAFNKYMEAGYAWQDASEKLIVERVLERFPTAKSAEVTVVLDESFTQHDIRILDGNGHELIDDNEDFPDDDAYGSWWLMASEGAVFSEGERVHIHISA